MGGDVIGDLNSRRGIVGEFTDKPGGMKVVKASVPLSEIQLREQAAGDDQGARAVLDGPREVRPGAGLHPEGDFGEDEGVRGLARLARCAFVYVCVGMSDERAENK